MKITEKLLLEKGACAVQVDRFVRLFPKRIYPHGVTVTVSGCIDVAVEFDWAWLARNLLSPHARRAYYVATDEAAKICSEALTAARAAFDFDVARKWEEYDQNALLNLVGAREDFNRWFFPRVIAYRQNYERIMEIFKEVCAPEWAKAFLADRPRKATTRKATTRQPRSRRKPA